MDQDIEFIRMLKAMNLARGVDQHIIQKKPTLKEQAIHAWEHVKHAVIEVGIDTKRVYRLRLQAQISIYNLQFSEFLEYKQKQKDILKFIPFTPFLMVPFAELLIPFYIMLFPNAMPSQFYEKKTIGEVTNKKVFMQTKAHGILNQKLNQVLGEDFLDLQTQVNDALKLESEQGKSEQIKMLDQKIFNQLASNWKQYREHLKFEKLTVVEKECVLAYFYKDFVSGVNIINRVINSPFTTYNLIKKKYNKFVNKKTPKFELLESIRREKKKLAMKTKPLRSFHGKYTLESLSSVRNILLRFQIWHQMKMIEKQDSFLKKDALSTLQNCNKQQIFLLSKQRGFAKLNKSQQIDFLVNYWMNEHDENKLDQNLPKDILQDKEFLFWIMVIRFKYQNLLV